MITFPQVEHLGHTYLIVPSELLEGVSTTQPPAGWWTEEFADQLEEEAAAIAERRAILGSPYGPIHSSPGCSGCFLLIEYMASFNAWSIFWDIFFCDADDAGQWLFGQEPPDVDANPYLGNYVVLDQEMPLELRTDRADPGRPQ
jgi:hypothetical protein